jgi:hypothetical protein
MRTRSLKLSVLLVASLLILSAGLSPALAQQDVRPVDIQFKGAQAQNRATFEIVFSGFVRFFQAVHHRVNPISPLTPPPPPSFEPIDTEYQVPIFWLGKPGQKNDPNEVVTTSIIDGNDPVM